ncbi:MAG: FliH/SctL family protein, partial [Solirubrobacteraceae bacterium]
VQPDRVLDTVRGALRRVTDRRRVTVLVDPADLELVVAALAELKTQIGGIEQCDVQADRRVGPGGAIVRTLESEVDATVETQLERTREVVQAELATREAHGTETAPGEERS